MNISIGKSAMLVVCSYKDELTIFMVVYRGKARYQRGHSAQYSGFKLATSTFVLSILEFMITSSFLISFYFTK